MAVGSGQITVISGLPGVGFFVLTVKKTFKICGFRKYKSRCAMPEGAIAELFQVFLGRLGLRIVMCSERVSCKAFGRFRHDQAEQCVPVILEEVG